jgi:pimeloyl-ACP methyl ester carboxylesterase
MTSQRVLGMISAIAGIVALGYIAACAYLWHTQRQLIFVPNALVDRTPADVGLEFVDLDIAVAAGSWMAAWWLPSRSADSDSAVLLYLHGNDGNLAGEVQRLQALKRYELPILAIDYRGYGRSTGSFPSEAQVYDDAVAAWDRLVRVQGIAPRRIVIYGHSLGAAVALELALRRGPACGIVLESPFTSMADMARLEYPWIPGDLLLNQKFDVLRKIERLEPPVVLVHGTADRVVPFAMGARLYGAAHAPKRLVAVEGAGHEDAMPNGGEPLRRAIEALARQCAG